MSITNSAPAGAQIPPADELAAVRAQIKDLEEREKELRELMLKDPSARTGNRFVAEIQITEPSRCDTKELRKNYPEIAAQFTFKSTVKTVVLKAITDDGEIVSIPRRKVSA